MKRFFFVAVLGFATLAVCQQKLTVPPSVIDAKTMSVQVYWPGSTIEDWNEVQSEGQAFVRKWKRYQLVDDMKKADLVAIVVVKPTTVYPGFWQRLAAGYLASSTTTCNAYTAGEYTTVNCSSNVGNAAAAAQLMLPSTVLNGSILIFNGADIRKDIDGGLKFMDQNGAQPIMAEFSDGRGSRPLIGVAKRLRKTIDSAAKIESQPVGQ